MPTSPTADYFIVDTRWAASCPGSNSWSPLQYRQHTLLRAVILTGENLSQFIKSVATALGGTAQAGHYAKLAAA